MDKREISRMLQRSTIKDLLDDGIENGSDLTNTGLSAERPGEAQDDAVAASPAASKTSITPAAATAQKSSTAETSTRFVFGPSAIRRGGKVWGRHKNAAADSKASGNAISPLGLLLGACFVIGGVVLFLSPRESTVFHAGRGWSGRVEHVSIAGSQVYAVIAVVLGLVLCAYSLYRPRD